MRNSSRPKLFCGRGHQAPGTGVRPVMARGASAPSPDGQAPPPTVTEKLIPVFHQRRTGENAAGPPSGRHLASAPSIDVRPLKHEPEPSVLPAVHDATSAIATRAGRR